MISHVCKCLCNILLWCERNVMMMIVMMVMTMVSILLTLNISVNAFSEMDTFYLYKQTPQIYDMLCKYTILSVIRTVALDRVS